MLKIMDETFSDKINLDELYVRKNELEDNKEKIYKTILSRVHKKIKLTSRQRTGETFTFFIIPLVKIAILLSLNLIGFLFILFELTAKGSHKHLILVNF